MSEPIRPASEATAACPAVEGAAFPAALVRVRGEDQFLRELRRLKKPGDFAAAAFSAPWCRECGPVERRLEDLACQSAGQALFLLVDDADEEWALKYGVLNYPTVKLFDHRQESSYVIDTDHWLAEIPDLAAGRTGLHYYLGKMMERRRDPAEAIRQYTLAIAEKPDNYRAWNDRGVLYDRYRHDHRRAFDDISRAIALQPEIPLLYKNRGLQALEMNWMSWAIADFERAASLEPQNDDHQANLGAAYLRGGRYAAGMALGSEWRTLSLGRTATVGPHLEGEYAPDRPSPLFLQGGLSLMKYFAGSQLLLEAGLGRSADRNAWQARYELTARVPLSRSLRWGLTLALQQPMNDGDKWLLMPGGELAWGW